MSATLYPEFKQAVENLIKEGVEPGKLITHAWIDDNLGLKRSDPQYAWKRLSRFQDFKQKLLEEYKIDLQSQKGKGYIVIAPQDQTKVAYSDTVESIGKSIKKGANRLKHVDIDKLTDGQRKENTDAISRLAALAGMSATKAIE